MHVQKYSGCCLLMSSVLPISSLVTFATGLLLSLLSSGGEEIIVTHKVRLPQNKIGLGQMEYKKTQESKESCCSLVFYYQRLLNSARQPRVGLFPEKIIVFMAGFED